MVVSLELLPVPLMRGVAGSATARVLAQLPRGTLVYLPNLPNDPPDVIEHALRHLRCTAPHLEPVPHIAAHRVPSAIDLLRRLDRWQAATDHQLSEVLVVRGDSGGVHDHTSHRGTDQSPSTPCGRAVGPFETSLHLLESGILPRRGIRSVGVCGHPEGIGSDIGVDEALGFLCEKLDFAARAGLDARVVTQVCFDMDRTTALIDALRLSGHASPVSIGLVGPTKQLVLERMAAQCGVSPPPVLPVHDPASDVQAAEAQDSIPLGSLRRLASWQAARGAAAGMQGIHLYPFGGVKRTFGWLRKVGDTQELHGLCLDTVSSVHCDGDG